MEPKEASQPSTGRDPYSTALDAASSRDEDELELEGTFTVSDGQVINEVVEKKAKVYRDEEDYHPQSSETIDNTETVAVTENGKEIQITKHPTFSGFLIQFKDGGQLPPQLGGTWTSYERALGAVRTYIGHRNEG